MPQQHRMRTPAPVRGPDPFVAEVTGRPDDPLMLEPIVVTANRRRCSSTATMVWCASIPDVTMNLAAEATGDIALGEPVPSWVRAALASRLWPSALVMGINGVAVGVSVVPLAGSV